MRVCHRLDDILTTLLSNSTLNSNTVTIIIIPISHMREPKYRESKYLVQSRTGSKWQTQDTNLGSVS